MNEILRFMQKRDERTDGRTDVQKAFYNLPTTAFGHRREIKIPKGLYGHHTNCNININRILMCSRETF